MSYTFWAWQVFVSKIWTQPLLPFLCFSSRMNGSMSQHYTTLFCTISFENRLRIQIRGFQRGFLWGGGKISIIGVVRAPVAIINFASNPCENLWVYIGFNKETPHTKRKMNYCNRCAHPPQVLRSSPPGKNPPFGNPQRESCCQKNDSSLQRQICGNVGKESHITGRPNGITDRETVFFELILLFIADTDTDEIYLGINFS